MATSDMVGMAKGVAEVSKKGVSNDLSQDYVKSCPLVRKDDRNCMEDVGMK